MGYTRNPVKAFMGVGRKRLGAIGALDSQFNSGMSEILGNYKWYIDNMQNKVIPAAIVEALVPTLEKSKTYCPKDTGALVASAFIEVSNFRGNARVVVGYAKNRNPEYAVAVHEMDYNHAAPTSKKFLQRSFEEDYFTFMRRIAAAATRNPANGQNIEMKLPIAKTTVVKEVSKPKIAKEEELRQQRVQAIRERQKKSGIFSSIDIRRGK